MTRRRVHVVIVAEDQQHACFLRRLLAACGVITKTGSVRVRLPQPGRGSAEQFVRAQYAVEVAAYRAKATYLTSLRVVIITDADTLTVAQRKATLAPPRKPHEKIAMLVPRRNVETWLHALRGCQADEETTYARSAQVADCTAEARRMCAWCRTTPAHMLPSMQDACTELKRLN